MNKDARQGVLAQTARRRPSYMWSLYTGGTASRRPLMLGPATTARFPREARQNLPLFHVNVLVHLNVNVPETRTSRFSGTCTFTSTSTFTC